MEGEENGTATKTKLYDYGVPWLNFRTGKALKHKLASQLLGLAIGRRGDV